MSLTVDLIRHAESKLNVDMANAQIPFIGGRQNESDLSELGEMQAPNLSYYALSHGMRPTEFYSSPAVRTKRTHELSSTVMGLLIEPLLDDRLQELDQGEWTNQPRTLYDNPSIKEEMDRLGSSFAPPGGESMDDVYRRTAEFLESLTTVEGQRHVWVHTHGVVIKTYIGRLLGWTHERTYKTSIDNASLTRLTYDNDWSVTFINRSSSKQSPSVAQLR